MACEEPADGLGVSWCAFYKEHCTRQGCPGDTLKSMTQPSPQQTPPGQVLSTLTHGHVPHSPGRAPWMPRSRTTASPPLSLGSRGVSVPPHPGWWGSQGLWCPQPTGSGPGGSREEPCPSQAYPRSNVCHGNTIFVPSVPKFLVAQRSGLKTWNRQRVGGSNASLPGNSTRLPVRGGPRAWPFWC